MTWIILYNVDFYRFINDYNQNIDTSITCDGLEFTDPVIGFSDVEPGMGVYAIMRRIWKNNAFHYDILYIGQTNDFEDRLTSNHEKYDCWLEHTNIVYHALYHMPHTTKSERESVENRLIHCYLPPCNALF